eukprot:Skav218605  [mRNA]  locus=scaffold3208:7685:11795:+ [translate_table: standard]
MARSSQWLFSGEADLKTSTVPSEGLVHRSTGHPKAFQAQHGLPVDLARSAPFWLKTAESWGQRSERSAVSRKAAGRTSYQDREPAVLRQQNQSQLHPEGAGHLVCQQWERYGFEVQ